MPRRILRERTDGRRKGYKEHSSKIYDRLSPELRSRMDALRGNNKRKNTERKAPR